MTTDEIAYTLDNTWEKAHQRLTLLESIYDPGTISRLTALGVGEGWRCLELGAGAGSMTRWLCDRVGPEGRVTAVDLEPMFIERDPRPNLEIHRRDILAEGFPGDGYDLIHARALFMHLPRRDELIADLAGHLRPGGVILLEEGDCFPLATCESALHNEVWDHIHAVVTKMGGDWCWARHLPARLSAAGLGGVTSIVEGQMYRGGSPWAELMAMSWEQVTPLLVEDGLALEQIAKATAELSDVNRWYPAIALIAAWGRRPS
jgi:SAM-dependent methyltransferase